MVSWKGLWLPSPLVSAFALNLLHSSRQGSTVFSDLCMRSGAETDTELELESFPPSQHLLGCLGTAS